MALAILALFPLVIVLVKRRSQKAFMKQAIHTTAEITHCEKRVGFRGAVYYKLSLQYETTNAVTVNTGIVGFRKYQKGDRIPLMYLPEATATFSIDYGRKTTLAILLTLLFFVAILCFCIWLYRIDLT